MKVYMVHVEQGVYSDWTYGVAGIFLDYQSAHDYIMSQSVEIDADGCHITSFDKGHYKVESVEHPIETSPGHFTLGSGYMDKESWFITEYEVGKGALVNHDYGVSVSFEGSED